MVKIIERKCEDTVPLELLEGKRHLTAEEIEVLEKNLNHNTDKTWSNVFVPVEQEKFDVSLIYFTFFSGFVIIGEME